MRRMYPEARKTWNPFWGCGFDCKYCFPSFRRQAKRLRRLCELCARFEPHFHPERLERPLPKTAKGEFIFTCDMGDIFFAKTEWIQTIIDRIRELSDRTFLIQSKNPATFHRFCPWPENVILGTTIETNNYELIWPISKAPTPFLRYRHLATLKHRRKLLSIEPIMRFNERTLLEWVREISLYQPLQEPLIVYVGYDSYMKANYLPEPSLAKTQKLIESLKGMEDEGLIEVRVKHMRRAWWEE